MTTSVLLYAHGPNFKRHVCLSKGKYVMSKEHELLKMAGAAQNTSPLYETTALVIMTPVPGSLSTSALRELRKTKP